MTPEHVLDWWARKIGQPSRTPSFSDMLLAKTILSRMPDTSEQDLDDFYHWLGSWQIQARTLQSMARQADSWLAYRAGATPARVAIDRHKGRW